MDEFNNNEHNSKEQGNNELINNQRNEDNYYRSDMNNNNGNNMNNEYNSNNNFQNRNFNNNFNNMNFGNGPSGRPPKNDGWKKLIIGTVTVLGLALAGTGGFYVAEKAAQNINQMTNQKLDTAQNKDENVTKAEIKQTEGATITSDSVSDVVTNVMPAIVSITTNATKSVQGFFGNEYKEPVQGSGSGIIIGQNNQEVLIATNNHVISGDNATVSVTFCDDESVAATVKGADSSADLAVVAVKFADIKDSTKEKILVASIGDSEKTKVGETAIAIGNALGYGLSVTVGHISALDREIAVEDSSMVLMQTDAAINPGNSGGALLNAKGELIGINSAKTATTDVEGMGYAIPISDALPIINDLMNREQLSEDEQAYFGAVGESIKETTSKRLGIPVGVYVMEVVEDSPAEKAGIVPGMVIVGMSGKDVSNTEDLKSILSYTKAGETVKVKVKVNKQGEYVDKEITVTLGSKADAKSNVDDQDNYGNEQYPDQGNGDDNGSGNGDDYGYQSPFDFFR